MKFYICDDNEKELSYYTKKLSSLAKKFNVELEIKTFSDGEKMLFQMEDELDEVDAIYLDINMPTIDGISVANCVQKMGYKGEIIFLTVSEKHFLQAFDLGAFNYIVKTDSDDERFELIFLRVTTLIKNKSREYIVLVGGGEHKKVDISEIDYFEVDDRIVTMYTDYDEFSFPSTIGKIENYLHGKGFIRVHRGILVSLRAIKSFDYREIVLQNDKIIPIGRTYQAIVNKELKEHHGKIMR